MQFLVKLLHDNYNDDDIETLEKKSESLDKEFDTLKEENSRQHENLICKIKQFQNSPFCQTHENGN